jgi:hypothetical protein
VCDGTGIIDRSWWWRWSIGAARLHEIVASDDQRAFHDHPWHFISIGLAGSYTEERPRVVARTINGDVSFASRCGNPSNRTRTYRAPWVLRRRATDLHSLTLHDGPVWTLVVMGRKHRTWGFANPDGWTNWRDFDDDFPERVTGTAEQRLARLDPFSPEWIEVWRELNTSDLARLNEISDAATDVAEPRSSR